MRSIERRFVGQKPKKIDLKISIKNFGPISNASFSLKPLTIFVGPNNSGKSYAAMLVHSLVLSYGHLQPHGPRGYYMRQPSFMQSKFIQMNKKIQQLAEQANNKDKITIPTTITNQISKSCFEDIFNNKLPDEITRNFGSPLTELIRIGKKSFNLELSNGEKISISYQNNKFRSANCPKLKIRSQVIKEQKKPTYDVSQSEEDGTIVFKTGRIYFHEFMRYELLDSLLYTIASKLSSKVPSKSYYFPAARSGILQGHKAISASIIKNAPYGGIEQIQIPKLSGVVSDFLYSIIVMPSRRGPFYKIAEQLENELLHGHIKLSSTVKGGFPEIKYDYLNKDIPLHRTSSTVSELAPFTLYLKYIVGKSSILIIEEPEAHLHPRNQLIFAKYIVKLIREGLNILITTHSVFLLEQLSMFLQASSLSAEVRQKKLGFLENDYLLPEEVSPYVFTHTSEGGNTVEPIDFSGKDGISQEEFVKISEILHDQSIRIEENLS